MGQKYTIVLYCPTHSGRRKERTPKVVVIPNVIRGDDPEIFAECELRNELGELVGQRIRCNPNALLKLKEPEAIQFLPEEIPTAANTLGDIKYDEPPLVVPTLLASKHKPQPQAPCQLSPAVREIPFFPAALRSSTNEMLPLQSFQCTLE